MYVRKKLDASYRDLLKALLFCLNPFKNRKRLIDDLCETWSNQGDALPALSVRTALDAWLSILNLPRGSEVIMTGINIPDMVTILEHHGLQIVPLDLNLETLEIPDNALENAITPKTRIVLVAHLFGARTSMNPIFRVTNQYPDILVAEDCAQAFTGVDGYLGDDRSDISLFSFGSIKTATALGGAMLRIQDSSQRRAVRNKLEEPPLQAHVYFAKKTLKYILLKTLTLRSVYSLFIKACRLTGRDFDEVIINSARGFNRQNLINLIRHQPCSAQLVLLKHRLKRHSSKNLDQRRHAGDHLNQRLPHRLRPAGSRNPQHSWWLFAVSVTNSKALVKELREAGFDATSSSTQLCVMPKTNSAVPWCERFMQGVVYLPVYNGIKDADLDRMAGILHEHPASNRPKLEQELALATIPAGQQALQNRPTS